MGNGYNHESSDRHGSACCPVTRAGNATVRQEPQDARCLIASSFLMDSDDADVKTAGLLAAQYYLGRLDGRSPGLDLEALLTREAERFTDNDRSALLASCGNVDRAAGQAFGDDRRPHGQAGL
jgi:hypothetical protein